MNGASGWKMKDIFITEDAERLFEQTCQCVRVPDSSTAVSHSPKGARVDWAVESKEAKTSSPPPPPHAHTRAPLVNNQSAIRKKMTPRVAFWVDRHGTKFTVFVWESDGLQFPKHSEQFMNSRVEILGKNCIDQI